MPGFYSLNLNVYSMNQQNLKMKLKLKLKKRLQPPHIQTYMTHVAAVKSIPIVLCVPLSYS